MDSFILQYSPWFILLCLIAGLTYALALYYKTKRFADKSKWLVYALFAARFLTVFFISFLLLSPLLKNISDRAIKPVLLLVQDYSLSLKNAYSDKELNDLSSKVKNIASRLKKKYEIHEFSLGGELKSGFRDTFNLKSTNISAVLDYANNAYDNKELGGIILLSDGIYNEGPNPDYFQMKNTAPVYTVALGDTTIKKDVSVHNIYHNSIAFAGDKMLCKADFLARNAGGSNPQVVLSEYGGEGQKIIIEKKTLNITGNDFLGTLEFTIDLNNPGIKRYNISVANLPSELSYKNNSRDFFIEVIDSRTEVLIYANNPHPDISAIRELLSLKKNYSVEIKFTGENIDAKKYDLVIFHNLPSARNNLQQMIETMKTSDIPAFFILGSQTNIGQFNKIQDLVRISNSNGSLNDVQAVIDKDFSLFIYDDVPGIGINNFPPLSAAFGNYTVSPDARILLYQRIRNINTNYPLIAFSTAARYKTAVLTASNFFKWKFFEYQQKGDFVATGALIDQAVQYLTLRKDKSQWQVRTSSNIYNETDNIQFYGELYNDNYQLINEPEAFIKVTDSNRKEYDYVLTRTNNHYELNAGVFPAGNYEFSATTTSGNKKLIKKGKFIIRSKDLEYYDMIADHSVLNKLSSRTGGAMFYPANSDKLVDKLLEADVKPVVYSSENTRHLLDYKLLFFLLLLLLSGEWLMRKMNGSI
ncbi:MAG: hypothetical protein ACM3PT_06480 [Deltaproteobacteria bacterium]